ncbi:MAG: GTP-binding protein, partial [Legionellales bacterium]
MQNRNISSDKNNASIAESLCIESLSAERKSCSFKFHMVGSPGVGKSSLLLRFADNTFTETFISTIGIDYKSKTLQLNAFDAKLSVWNVWGHERYRTMGDTYRGTNAVLLCMDITDRNSFTNINTFLDNTHTLAGKNIARVLVITKDDLPLAEARVVSEQEIAALAERLDSPVIYTSAKAKHNVDDAFLLAIKEVLKKREIEDNPLITSENNLVGLKIMFNGSYADSTMKLDTAEIRTLPIKQLLVSKGTLLLKFLIRYIPIFKEITLLQQNIIAAKLAIKEIQFVSSKTNRLAFKFSFNNLNDAEIFSEMLSGFGVKSKSDSAKEKRIHSNNTIYLSREDLIALASKTSLIDSMGNMQLTKLSSAQTQQISSSSKTSSSCSSSSSCAIPAKTATALQLQPGNGDVWVKSLGINGYLSYPDRIQSSELSAYKAISARLKNIFNLIDDVTIAEYLDSITKKITFRLLIFKNPLDAEKIANQFNKAVLACFDLNISSTQTPTPCSGVSISTDNYSYLLNLCNTSGQKNSQPRQSTSPQLASSSSSCNSSFAPASTCSTTISSSSSFFTSTQGSNQPQMEITTTSSQNNHTKSVEEILKAKIDDIGIAEMTALVKYCEDKSINTDDANDQ